MGDTFSFFGGMDAAEVGTDPFYVAPDNYWCVCSDANITKNDKGFTFLNVVWQVQDQESKYFGKKIRQSSRVFDFPSDPGEAKAFWDSLDAKEQMQVQFTNKLLQEGFALTPKQLQAFDVSNLVGAEAWVTVIERQGTGENSGKTYTNVGTVMNDDLFQEKNGGSVSSGTSSASFGI